MYELVGDCQIPPGTQAVDSRAVADVSAAWTPPVLPAFDLMQIFSHPDVQAGSTPEPPALSSNYTLGGIVAGAEGFGINGLLPVEQLLLFRQVCSSSYVAW